MSIEKNTVCFKEEELLPLVAAYVRRKGFRLQASEIPFYEYSIDLYGFSGRENITVAVELKVRNWRRALEQSLIYQLCADYVYIAMPDGNANAVDLELLQGHGIGLIAVNKSGRCKCVAPAIRTSEVRDHYRGFQIAHLMRGTRQCLK